MSWWPPEVAVHAEQFRKGLRDLGYVEGRDITVEAHFTDGNRDRTRAVVRKLIEDKVDILVVSTTPAIAVTKEEAGSLHIVISLVSDPLAAGFAASLSNPGGNLTGMTTFSPGLVAKRVELMKEIRPELRVIAFLGSSRDVNTGTFLRNMQTEADRSGLRLIPYLIDGPARIDRAVFEAMRHEGAEAVIVQPIFMGHQERIIHLANAAGLPIVADYSLFAHAGAMFTYGIDDHAQMRRAAYFVDRIFKGAHPGDLPIQQPTEFRLVVNAGAAKRFGWAIPLSVLARADEVIE
ncbi:putative ABC transport system substrate-binding protein [Microvirga lupini]|uniref:Putative ABC transport system substrate-binding protein n=1 Tax=Microvirga lupini TaxID=420324 RepID=A0A7W4YXX1_9HYPH|nr:putative ABC transport system substrate-binding protein [Microvirga lupini]